MKYSKTTGTFYPDDIVYTEYPMDVIEVTQDEFDIAMNRPTGSILDVLNGFLVIVSAPAETLAEMKLKIWNSIKSKRDAALAGGVFVSGKWFHTDETSRLRYLTLLKMANTMITNNIVLTNNLLFNEQPIQWKTMDGSFITMTGRLALDINDAVTSLDFTVFALAEHHKATMELCTAPDSYDFSTGWPTYYVT